MFSEGFYWGAAAASYQIEGAAAEDGKGKSVWDVISDEGKLIINQEKGNVSCDHYHRYNEDIALMKKIGLRAYRLSMSWPRILPDGVGKINQKGIDFYDRLIDELLKNDIEPFVTLFHWDYPWELFLKGGWLNSDSPKWFEEYADIVSRHFSDRVKYWITINEPQCFILLGHMSGEHAPALKLSTSAIMTAIHNTLLAHGRAVKVIRENSGAASQIGYAPVGSVYYPKNETELEIKYAREFMFSKADQSLWSNEWWMDPIFFGKYPEEGVQKFREYMPRITDDDMNTIAQHLDFFGCNIYNGRAIEENNGKVGEFKWEDGSAKTAMDWRVTPECLYWGPKFFYERYKTPVIITENGVATNDWVMMDGKVHDYDRIDFLSRYISQLRRAANDGIDIKGYFLWSIMDNFEWAFGYEKRFGLINIDYKTLKRTLKDSAYWYKKVIDSNGEDLSF